jgi:hypothetical protein
MIIAAMAASANTMPPAASNSKNALILRIAILPSFPKYKLLKTNCQTIQ